MNIYRYIHVCSHALTIFTSWLMLEGGLVQFDRIRKGAGREHEMKSTEERKLLNTQHHHHAAYWTEIFGAQLFNNLSVSLLLHCVCIPDMLGRDISQKQLQNHQQHHRPGYAHKTQLVRHLNSLSWGMQTAKLFDLQGSQVYWQTDGSQTQTQGQVRDRARQSEGPHTHSRQNNNSSRGEKKRGRGGREDSTGHRLDERRSSLTDLISENPGFWLNHGSSP